MALPLESYPIASTTDPDEAQAILSRELMNLRFESVRDRPNFRLDMNGIQLGQTTIAYNQFRTETVVDVADVHDENILLAIGVGSQTVTRVDGECVDNSRQWAVCSSSQHLHIDRSPGSGVIFLETRRRAIDERFREIVGRHPRRSIAFERSVDGKGGIGAQIYRMLEFAISESARDDAFLQNPLFRANLDDLLLNSLLMLPHSHSCELDAGHSRLAAPWLVRRAEEYLEAHAGEPITISDVVKECGCSRRTLFSTFQRHRGYSPMHFLTECKLQQARRMLLSPNASDTVTLIAGACGFLHGGRFSAMYQKRFGEKPSETLRHSSRR